MSERSLLDSVALALSGARERFGLGAVVAIRCSAGHVTDVRSVSQAARFWREHGDCSAGGVMT